MRKILIAEDDRDIAELERDYLRASGYDVDIESDGRRALERARTGAYGIIIVDLMLPSLCGFELIGEIRRTLEIPLIVVSAKTEDIDKIRGLDLGADDYVVKPFSPAELVARVKSHERRYDRLRGDVEPQTIIVGELEIDVAARKVFVGGNEVSLTSTEFSLLLFLAENQDRAFTKERIFSAVWGDDYAGDLATVAVHVQKIRKKTERDPANPRYIETLWGTGYRFNSGKR